MPDVKATGPRRPLGSLRGQLMRWLLVPLAGLIVVNSIVIYGNVHAAVNFAYDRTLLATARAISERVQMLDGRVVVDVPYVALDIFESDSPGRLYYKITGIAGEFISGYGDLPPVPAGTPRSDAYPALVHFYDETYDGHALRVAALHQPIYDGTVRGMALIQVGETLDARNLLTRDILTDSLWRLTLLVVVQALLALFALRLALGPLVRLRQEVERREPTELAQIDPNIVHKEVRPLIDAINHYMAVSRRLIDRQRRFIADASHQLRTPLTLLKTNSELALRADDPASVRDILRALGATTDQAVRLSNQLLSLARVEQVGAIGELSAIRLEDIARQVCLELAPAAVKKRIAMTLDVQAARERSVQGNAVLVHEAIVNLVDNAIRYTPAGGSVVVRILHDPAAAIEIVDSGSGIPPAERERVLEPFYRIPTRGEGDRHGSGLGLAIVADICRSHGATLTLSDGDSGCGLKVRIAFADSQAPPGQAAGSGSL